MVPRISVGSLARLLDFLGDEKSPTPVASFPLSPFQEIRAWPFFCSPLPFVMSQRVDIIIIIFITSFVLVHNLEYQLQIVATKQESWQKGSCKHRAKMLFSSSSQ